ncbi:hypothetical protein OQH60_05490 [Campylobacter sp. MIT 21-1685]|uniref:hypothetical protein n=1 Tax=unclassified Campylobacter TaxID=2593542 RepID=UPI00224AD6D4|nr:MULTISPECIES: hypothetical protein [unclassified Campylobacter]MCX2683345.1 hypothetical protein [Campylobacter sp. MIT 21-1684]MCX2751600.1 hypothetical protein [Campylobacter sp. MIT 21-1682]MCX2807799.1 hypothetical protein [Campylobacter sp. MIT 21-1685]
MACFTAVIPELALVYVIKKKVEKKEALENKAHTIALSTKLSWLITMLWGGVFLLCIEHLWHGEIVPWFPFLTAMQNPQDTQAMFVEILTIGTCIDLFIPLVWFVACFLIEKANYKQTRYGA